MYKPSEKMQHSFLDFNQPMGLRMALGALSIQTKFQYADRELVEQITQNPYLQYFIGFPGYQEEAPFDASKLVLFRNAFRQKC